MLKIVGRSSIVPKLYGIREVAAGFTFRHKRIGVMYEEADAEALVHILRFLRDFQRNASTHTDELPHILFANKKHTANTLLANFEKLADHAREVNGSVIIRFEYKGFTRWLIQAYIEDLMKKIGAASEEAEDNFAFDRESPLFYARSFTDAYQKQKAWEEVRDFFSKLLEHFPDISKMH